MYPTAPDLTGRTEVFILPLTDPSADDLGFDPRSHYSETFWLPILGPSTLWLVRSIAHRFDTEPEGFCLDIDEASAGLGIRSKGGKHSVFQRSIGRVVSFNMGRTVDDQTLAVRRVLPPLHSAQVRRLPPRLQRQHADEIARRELNRAEDERRATEVASTLIGLGDSPDLAEQQLVSWGVAPTVAHHAVNVAWAQKARRDANTTSAA